MLRLTHFFHDLIDKSDNRLVYLMSLVDSFQHLVLRHLIGSRLDHHHLLCGGCNRHFQIALVPLLLRRIHDQLTIDHSHLCHGTGAVKGNIGNARCDRRTQHGHQLRTTCRVYAHDHIIQSHVIAVVLREQRTHRPVDHAARQHCILGSLTFSLVKTTRNLTHGIQLLFIFYAAGKEIDPFSRFLGRRSRGQHCRLTVLHESASVRLFAYSADICTQGASGKFHCVTLVHALLSLT